MRERERVRDQGREEEWEGEREGGGGIEEREKRGKRGAQQLIVSATVK